MNTDHIFQIGKTHTICEDFALSGKVNEVPFAIICDGCSASPDSDFGARLLAFAARSLITKESISNIGVEAISLAGQAMSTSWALHAQTMDATLLVAKIQDGQVAAALYGDGVFYHRETNGLETMIHVAFEMQDGEEIKSAPSYLSYFLNPFRMNDYSATNTRRIVSYVTLNPELQENPITRQESLPAFSTTIMNHTVKEGDVIGLCSDGINTFRRPNGELIPWVEVAKEFFRYKTTEGVFVNRRINAFKRSCLKDNITHSDDISVASIIV